MRFVKALHQLLDCILSIEPATGLTYPCKFDLTDAYIKIRVRPEDAPSVAFLIMKENADKKQQVGFHIFIPMGYMESVIFF